MSDTVILGVYDISNGMAKGMSMMLIGQQIEALYHTSIIVYGKQYYFGGGICKDAPQQTPYGKPIRKIDLGKTQIPKQILEEYLDEIAHKYTMQSYNVIEHNCNHFSDEIAEFLVGKGIPKQILNQAEQLLKTPMGQMIKPMLMQMQGNIQNPPPGFYQ